ncbi:hypothetical protein Tco_0398548, partial [Tanacetum coccineum]
TLINETQDDLMFDVGVLDDDAEQGIKVKEVEVSIVEVVTTVSDSDAVPTTAEVVTTVSAPTTTIDELNLAKTLIKIKAAKPKTIIAITTTATTVTTVVDTRPKAKGIVMQEPSENPLKHQQSIL